MRRNITVDNGIFLLPRIPVSTYRLQFNYQFRFEDAKKIVPYLYELGITDIYSSPYLEAKEGSLHGYDIVDHNTLNPEVGSGEEYNKLINELQKYDMGQILDIVPNHMCITSEKNVWWMDVLENGPSSLYAKFFDIVWEPVKKELKNKILLPFLGDQYGRILDNQEIKLSFEEGAFFIYFYENKFPIRPQTYTLVLEHRISELKNLLSRENLHLVELLSIITALKHLPPYTETENEKISERQREKEVTKKRLWNLYDESLEIRMFIEQNIKLFNGIKGEPGSLDLLDRLLSEQAYRLSYWRVATEEINYRRFFDINELASIRMEDPVVFKETHKLIFKLVREGKVTGLRVDYPDGLYNPLEYFQRLQRDCFLCLRLGHLDMVKEDIPSDVLESLKENDSLYFPHTGVESDIESEILEKYKKISSADHKFKPFYIVGEKILIKDERMPEDWPIFSTTGYVFLNTLNGIFVDTENMKAFEEIYTRFIKTRINYQEIIYEKKKLITHVAMASEINTLGHYLNRLSEKNRHTRDFTLNSLTSAIVEVIAFFPVYRTYANATGINERDKRYIELAVSKAKKNNPAISGFIFDFLKDVLLLNYSESFGDADKKEWIDFVMRFQQITGPVMAKGLEDTAFYVYNRLVSLNEVGGSPDRFGTSLETFHGKNIERIKFWPNALIATSTHDTKRSEDVRARINILSEIPDEWRKCLITWKRLNKKNKPVVEGQRVPAENEEYLLYQTLIGAWPVSTIDEFEYDIFKKRIKNYMLKALRESKINTSWISPNTIYEDALSIFIEKVMDNKSENQFLKDFIVLQKKVSHYGMFNSLSQTLLKITSPGVPDFYQGTEIWDFSLVDPDNRRPVNYSIRIEMFRELKRRESEHGLLKLAKELTINKGDGMIKLYLIYKALNYRKANRELFEIGEYVPLETMGERSNNICAFLRRIGNVRAIVVIPRFLTKLISENDGLPFGKIWQDTFIVIPFADIGAKYRNVFTGEIISIESHKGAIALFLSDIFMNFPVALMENIS
ncbi:MAG: malto-oligosyltrehalose synthase [Nitrospirae bacterium RBG_13_41_22]|nr:MAG: malto-oligosyltrehalose synthase [Nitrospirae bacterium RBG_13_41_22]